MSTAAWRTSTYSGGDGGSCVEVTVGHPEIVPVRDSENPGGPHLVFRAASWVAFVTVLWSVSSVGRCLGWWAGPPGVLRSVAVPGRQ
ncbi:DUF397 domain-containing protein [Streptomyces sp. NPDC048518]|uniref:DUF397 domain-containing protein n=1 Tax=Streptomyces sp. NPDC048518 TaxID=3155029 RepID=UPI0033D51E8D